MYKIINGRIVLKNPRMRKIILNVTIQLNSIIARAEAIKTKTYLNDHVIF